MSDSSVGFVDSCLRDARRFLAAGDKVSYRTLLRDIMKSSGEYPVLGLDIDGVITDFPDIFRVLSSSWPGLVVIVSYRSDAVAAEKLLRDSGIYFDKLVLSPTMDKSGIIRSEGIGVFIDDQDECVLNVDVGVVVLKVRNGGNFDDGKWLYSKDTGRLV